MHTTTATYKEKIAENSRDFDITIEIQHESGTINLTKADIALGSFVMNESTQSGDSFSFGGVVASDVAFAFVAKSAYAAVDFTGAIVRPSVGLLVGAGSYEMIPMGVFIVDEQNRQQNRIELKAIDQMIKLETPYSESALSYPATLYQIYTGICTDNNIQIGSLDFPNKTYSVSKKPQGEHSYRDILRYVAELSGSFAKMSRGGKLELRWFGDTDFTVASAQRYTFKKSDEKVKITGVRYKVDDETVYETGTDDYMVDITGNPLLQDSYSVVLPNILAVVADTEFVPFDSEWIGDMSVEAGDGVLLAPVYNAHPNFVVSSNEQVDFAEQGDIATTIQDHAARNLISGKHTIPGTTWESVQNYTWQEWIDL